MTQEVKEAVEKLLRSGERERAIAHLQTTFNISVQDASLLIETLEREIGIITTSAPEPAVETVSGLDGQTKAEVAQLLETGRKMEAVKLARERQRIGLREALTKVEEVAREMNPNYSA